MAEVAFADGLTVSHRPYHKGLSLKHSSINCLGRCVASYTTRDARVIAELLAMVP